VGGASDFPEENEMSVTELQELEEIKGLLVKGQQTGVLTYGEVATAVAELDVDEADVEELHGFLEKAEIELVEEVVAAVGPPRPRWTSSPT
jgi:RNA polymerase primary sigma factor